MDITPNQAETDATSVDDVAAHLMKSEQVIVAAIMVGDTEDPTPLLLAQGIYDPVAIQFVYADRPASSSGPSGTGFGSDIEATLQVIQNESSSDAGSADSSGNTPAHPSGEQSGLLGAGDSNDGRDNDGHDAGFAPDTVTLPAAYGHQSLAPVRKRRS